MAGHAVERGADQQAARRDRDLDAIGRISEADARKVLLVLCDGDERVRGAALGVYGTMSKTDVCVRCNLKFDQDNNSAEACCYHTGTFELDESLEFWEEVDDYDGGGNPFYQRDSAEVRTDCPEGFRWTCCDRVGDVAGCRKGRHEGRRHHQPRPSPPALAKMRT
ncbi:hypothetical protein CTA2_2032 [Colletotrichum tanaceti]|uniref:C2H2-type domain-containing protein n=1 Tax=Colletotrichum tanaceti TaxID=1306861 RepID=A0A4U6X7I5_9PEZI|nr:hypothetical protein CTA2_2032 [Colletotrichum tanaceti]TKW51094.1 hypothetical protein CTA1_6141 [Colletotrichum tanaceti]